MILAARTSAACPCLFVVRQMKIMLVQMKWAQLERFVQAMVIILNALVQQTVALAARCDLGVVARAWPHRLGGCRLKNNPVGVCVDRERPRALVPC